jgi:hypothetical protein
MVQLTHQQLNGHGHMLHLKPHKHNRVNRCITKGTGCRLHLDEEEIQGSGMWEVWIYYLVKWLLPLIIDYFKREPGLLPPHARSMLEKIGGETITSIKIFRYPIEGESWINYATLGSYAEAKKDLGYDKMYHLGLLINNKYRFEKEEVVKLREMEVPESKHPEFHELKLPSEPMIIASFIDNTRERLGNEAFSNYNAATKNCQIFSKNALEANGISTAPVKSWFQDVEAVFKKMYWYAKNVSEFATDLGALRNVWEEGYGVEDSDDDTKIKAEPKGLYLKFHPQDLSPIEEMYNKLGGPSWKGAKMNKNRESHDHPLRKIPNTKEPKFPYIAKGQETRKGKLYDVIQVSLYYRDNPSPSNQTWHRFPYEPIGYHDHDIEFVSIYYDPETKKPEKVYFSVHNNRTEGTWMDYNKCHFHNGYLVVYVARNSHSNWADNGRNGLHVRYERDGSRAAKGLADDYTSEHGPKLAVPFDEMGESFDWGSGINLSKGLRGQPNFDW